MRGTDSKIPSQRDNPSKNIALHDGRLHYAKGKEMRERLRSHKTRERGALHIAYLFFAPSIASKIEDKIDRNQM